MSVNNNKQNRKQKILIIKIANYFLALLSKKLL